MSDADQQPAESSAAETDETAETDEPVEDTEDAEDPAPSGLSWPRVAVLGAAMAFLGFAGGLFVTRDNPPAADSVDVGFYQDMISHHDQALQLASLALSNAGDPTVRGFAQEVFGFQMREIGVMETTLHEWGYGRAERSDEAMAWMGMPVPVAEMPGMLSDAQIEQMRNARGAEADALFLELMARHHAGGLHMAQAAASQADDHDVREWAARMARNQAIEINEYAQTAERLGLPIRIEKVPVPAAKESDDH